VLFFKLFWLGIKDLFEQFLTLSMFSIAWWLSIILVIPGPPATVALFSMADPRRQTSTPDMSDAIAVFKGSFTRAWGFALCTVPLIIVLLWNLTSYAGTSQVLAAIVPLWAIMLILILIVTVVGFAVAGTMESGVKNAFRGAMYVLVSRPFMSISLSIVLLVLSFFMTITVLPMLLVGPALIACIVNRFVLTILGVEIIDPLAPTDERAFERERGINPDKGFIGRLRNENKRTRPQ
jgi:uncharacterized membrane protein YesL